MADLNGRYPFLFNFQLLQKLTMGNCYLKWDFDMLAEFPSLKELDYDRIPRLNGSLSSLRVLKDTLEKVAIRRCPNDVMDLADFPRLKELDLGGCTVVTGDIRDIREHDFPALESLLLPKGASMVENSMSFFQNVSEVPSFIQAIHGLLQRSPTMFKSDLLTLEALGRLS
jgi:hypothetical protein